MRVEGNPPVFPFPLGDLPPGEGCLFLWNPRHEYWAIRPSAALPLRDGKQKLLAGRQAAKDEEGLGSV
ncbi:MAG: hypothetical protein ABW224_06865, partial [Kibdelosporangium sp.]